MLNSQLNKKIVLTLLTLASVYAAWCGFSYYGQVKLEKLEYRVIGNITRSQKSIANHIGHSNKVVQVRTYGKHLAVQAVYRGVQINVAMDMGLQDIGEYFLGKNSQLKKIQMALPIMVEKLPSLNAYLVSFIVPQKYLYEDLPEPINKRLAIREVPSKTLCSKAWLGGLPNEDLMDYKKKKLQKILQNSNYTITGNAALFQYDSPLTPSWMRKNEVVFEIKQKQLLNIL